MKEPLISVVMSVFNEPETYLRESVESILKQTISDFEFIIVIDNPEYKQASQIIRSYANNDNRIKIITNRENEGLASSLNKGFSIAKGEYIARMDGDDISFPQRLEKQLAFMQENPDIKLIGSSMVYIDKDKNILESKLARSDYEFLKRFALYGGTPCLHPTWFFKKDLLDKLKGYRNLPTSQDYDFLMRTIYLKHKVSNIKEPLLYHRIHPARISAEKNFYQLRLTRYMMKAIKEGFILEDERFSSDTVGNIVRTPKILHILHRPSSRLFNAAYSLRRKNKKPLALLLRFAGMLISPYELYHIFWCLTRSLMLAKEGKEEKEHF